MKLLPCALTIFAALWANPSFAEPEAQKLKELSIFTSSTAATAGGALAANELKQTAAWKQVLAWEAEDAKIFDLLHKRQRILLQFRNATNGFIEFENKTHSLTPKAQMYWQRKMLKEMEEVNTEILSLSKSAEREGVRDFLMGSFTEKRQTFTRRMAKLGLLKYIALPAGIAGMILTAPSVYDAVTEDEELLKSQ